MLPLDDPLWTRLESSHGNASRLPVLIQQLQVAIVQHPTLDGDLIVELSDTCHQWSTYDSTYATVPHLVRICTQTPPDRVGRIELLAWIGWCVACLRLNRTEAPQQLMDWFEQSLPTARDLIAESLPHVDVREDAYQLRTLRSLLAAFATCHGNPALGFVLYELEAGGANCAHCGGFFHPMKSSLNPFYDLA